MSKANIEPSSAIPKPDWKVRLMVCFLHLIKLVRKRHTVEGLRKMALSYERKKVELPPGVEKDQIELAGLTCDRLLNSEAEYTILHFYGGGYCVRIPNMELPAIVQFSKRIKAEAYMPWYGLAPENPFPQPPKDCFAAYQALLDQGKDPKKIILSGLSAGGGNVFSVLALIKQNELPMPACAVLMSPAGDALFTGKSCYENAWRDPMFRLTDMLYFSEQLLPPEQRANPLINVSLMDDFTGYPPMYLTASNTEIMRDSAVMAYEKAQAAGVPSQLDISPGGVHGISVMLWSNQAKVIWQRTEEFVVSHMSAD